MGEDANDRNRWSRDRLRAVARTLSDEELALPIDPPWTAAALFAHMAFWDRFVHARWQLAAEAGAETPVPIEDTPMELVNRAALHQWTLVPPRVAVQECLAAAEALDGFIQALAPSIADRLIQEGRQRLVDRSLHRRDHLGTLESAFPGRFPR